MKTSLRSFLIAALLSVTAVFAQAAEVASQAIVLKLSGSPQVSIAGQPPVALKLGDKLPEGAIITTDKSSSVELQVFTGTNATIKPDTTATLSKLTITSDGGAITKQTSLIDLAVGEVVSTLDPSKKSINDYSIKTPRGVAAARGTVFSTYYSSNGSLIVVVTSGTVMVRSPSGALVAVPPGRAVTISKDGVVTPMSAAEGEQKLSAESNGSSPDNKPTQTSNTDSSTTIDTTINVVSPSNP